MKWLNENWFKLSIVILFSLLLAGGAYYLFRVIPDQQKLTSEFKDNQVRLDKTNNLQENIDAVDETVNNTQSIKNNNDTVLINFKLDVQNSDELRTSLASATYSSPDELCPNIIANRTSRNNIYYAVLDALEKLENDYGKYRDSIPYISTWLTNLKKNPQITKDKCESLGFNIP